MTIQSIITNVATIILPRTPDRPNPSKHPSPLKPQSSGSISPTIERAIVGTIKTCSSETKKTLANLNPAIFRIGIVGPLVTLATLPGEAYSAKLIAYFSGNGNAPKVDKTLFTGASFVVLLRIATRSTVFNVQDAASSYLSTNLENATLDNTSKQFVVGLVSGAVAGLAETVFHPFGQINTRIQTSPNVSIYDAAKRLIQSGTMFKGIGITAGRDVISAVTTFTTLQVLKSAHDDADLKNPKTMAKIGAISGGISGGVTALPAIYLNHLANNPFGEFKLPGLKPILTTTAARSVTLSTVVGVMMGMRALHEQIQTEHKHT